jgi:hypothetical protein
VTAEWIDGSLKEETIKIRKKKQHKMTTYSVVTPEINGPGAFCSHT